MGHKFPPGHPSSAASAFAPQQPELGVVADDVEDAAAGALTASEANARLMAGKSVAPPPEPTDADPEPEPESEPDPGPDRDGGDDPEPDDEPPAPQKATRPHRAHKAAAKGKS